MTTHLDDPLDDLFNASGDHWPTRQEQLDALKARREAAGYVAPEHREPDSYMEACQKCRGTGRFYSYSGRNVGPCHACKGAGKRTFSTSPEYRAQARATSAAKKIGAELAKNVMIEDFKTGQPAVWAWMQENVDQGSNGFPFAISLHAALLQYGSLTERQLEAALKCIAKRAQARLGRVANAPVVDTAGIDRLKAAFDHAVAYSASKGRTMRRPRITVGCTEISPAKATSANPGALYVKTTEGQYLGKIVDGRFLATRECTDELRDRVLAFIADPKAAAEAYGIETGICCICNATLTNKVSIERGIGPICAEKMGW